MLLNTTFSRLKLIIFIFAPTPFCSIFETIINSLMTSQKKEKVHFIAIGGSVMHSLAIALRLKGLEVTGSDDNFYNPSRQRLKDNGLLPEKNWVG
jgi:hypothetical protein